MEITTIIFVEKIRRLVVIEFVKLSDELDTKSKGIFSPNGNCQLRTGCIRKPN
jgi:hypothetical protein